VAAVPVAFMASALMGAALERSVIRFLYGRPLETLLATWGISLMLMQLVRSHVWRAERGRREPELDEWRRAA
jgi:urea transport system permease protein